MLKSNLKKTYTFLELCTSTGGSGNDEFFLTIQVFLYWKFDKQVIKMENKMRFIGTTKVLSFWREFNF